MIDQIALIKGIRNLFPVDESEWCQVRKTEHAARVLLSGLIVDLGPGSALRAQAHQARKTLLQDFLRKAGELSLDQSQAAAFSQARQACDSDDATACERALAELMLATSGNPQFSGLIAHGARISADLHRDLHQAYLAETAFGAESGGGGQGALAPVVDAGQILAGLRDCGIDTTGITVSAITPVLGGYSKQTLICEFTGGHFPDGRLVVRASTGVDYSGAPVEDEFATAVALHRSGVKVPRPIGLSSAGGTALPFMLMEWADGAMLGFTPREPHPALCRESGYQLGLVHSAPVEAFGHVEGAGMSNVEQMLIDIAAQEKKWRDAGGSDPIVAYAINWLRQHVDRADGPRVMTHGDYRGHNMLQKDGTLTAILDWEHGRISHPARDFGYSSTFITAIGGWDLFAEGYRAAGGTMPDRQSIHYFEVFASLFKTAVLTQIASGYRGDPTQQLATAASVIHQAPLEVTPLLELLDLQ